MLNSLHAFFSTAPQLSSGPRGHPPSRAFLPPEYVHSGARAFATERPYWQPQRSGGSLSCRNCGKTFAYKQNMTRHRRKCEGACHLQCQYCGQQFNRRDYYSAHLRAKHNVVVDSVLRRPRDGRQFGQPLPRQTASKEGKLFQEEQQP